MEPKVAIIGSAGNIGTRYRAILNFMKIPFFSYDPKIVAPFTMETQVKSYPLCPKVIICTPTKTHLSIAAQIIHDVDSLLIEKPLFENEDDYLWEDKYIGKIRMVCNYKWIDGTGGETYYNNYHHGNEEPWANLLQIIGLARGSLKIETTSPIWQCTLNGRDLTLHDVHRSYILMIDAWLNDPTKLVDLHTAYEWHKKAKAWAA